MKKLKIIKEEIYKVFGQITIIIDIIHFFYEKEINIQIS